MDISSDRMYSFDMLNELSNPSNKIFDTITQPLNIGFLIFAVALIVIGKYVPALSAMQVFIVTYTWVGLSFYVGTDRASSILVMGFIVWLSWLLEYLSSSGDPFNEQPGQLDFLLREKTNSWVPGNDSLFWVISVPLFAFWIGLWGLNYMGDDETWMGWLSIVLLGYATWLTTWRISCVMPFIQGSTHGGADFIPVNIT